MNEIAQSKIARLHALHAEILGGMKKTIAQAIEAGGILVEIKEELPHGSFIPWIKENTGIDIRTAQNYMRAYKNRDRLMGKYESVSHLGEAYALLTEHKPGAIIGSEKNLPLTTKEPYFPVRDLMAENSRKTKHTPFEEEEIKESEREYMKEMWENDFIEFGETFHDLCHGLFTDIGEFSELKFYRLFEEYYSTELEERSEKYYMMIYSLLDLVKEWRPCLVPIVKETFKNKNCGMDYKHRDTENLCEMVREAMKWSFDNPEEHKAYLKQFDDALTKWFFHNMFTWMDDAEFETMWNK